MQFIKRLELSPIKKVLQTGETLGPMRLVDRHSRTQYLEASAYYSRFRRGDNVQLRVKYGKSGSEFFANTTVKDVTYPREGKLRVAIGIPRSAGLDQRTDYFIYPTENEFMLQNLRSMVRQRSNSLEATRRSTKLDRKPAESRYLDALNPSQTEAFRYLLSLSTDGCVQGPPGTGKTQLLLALVAQLMSCGLTVGIAAFTHAAVDNALSRISVLDLSQEFCRVGRSEMINESRYPPDWIATRTEDSFGSVSKAIRLYAATTHAWTLSPAAPDVDLLIIDEAGQIPVYFIPVLLKLGKKIICLGDHKQLPPVLQGDHSKTVPNTDLFSSFVDNATPMLATQYRMNSQIQDWPSFRFYDGRLEPHASNADRDILSGLSTRRPKLLLGNNSVQLITQPNPGNGQANPAEAKLVAELIERLFKASKHLPAEQIGVISPRRMHNGAIIQALQQKFGVEIASQIQVDTVERYQGQEREVSLFSFGSGLGLMKSEDVSFVGNARRLNVAVTRARSRLYCFATDDLVALGDRVTSDGPESDLASFFASFPKPKA